MRNLLIKKCHLIASAAILILAITVKTGNFPFIERLQQDVFDSYQRLFPRTYTSQPVKIIDIDDESLNRIGQWPWPREKLAGLLHNLQEAGAAAIALDIVFAESDRYSPNHVLKSLPQHQKIKAFLGNNIPDYDAVFAQAIADSNTITGFVLTDKESAQLPLPKAGISYAGNDPLPHVTAFEGSIISLAGLEQAATGNGALNSTPDKDGIIRQLPLLLSTGGKIFPSLMAESLRVAQGASSYMIKTAGASGETDFGTDSGITHIKIGAFEIPTNRAGQLWMYYTPYVAERYIPAWKILESDFDPATINGNILFIGTSAAGLKDIRSTPLNPVSSGVEVHAQAAEQILDGTFLRRPDWTQGAEILGMALAGVLLISLMAFLPAMWGAVFTLLTLSSAWIYSLFAFRTQGLLIEPLTPSLAILLVYATESLSKYIVTEYEGKHIRNAFSHYMSPVLVKELAANPDKLKLGGEVRNLTVLFCDIRGFTTISETMNAEELTRFINSFLTPMTKVILDRKGTIDKYIGDCIMAFWNAPLDDPDHAANGCRAALQMREALKELNQQRKWKLPINIGIGLNTGDCCVGNMGSDMRFDYSVIGDDVNLASRLEGQSKTYGVDIVIGQATHEKLSSFATLELDCIRVKGKNEPVHIYALLGDETLAQNLDFAKFHQDFNKFLERYRNQAWTQAEALLKTCEQHVKKLPELTIDGLFQVYYARITEFRLQPLPGNWDWVYVAESK